MADLTFVTGNSIKYYLASKTLGRYDLTVEQERVDIDEVQSEDAKYIAFKKAEAAFALLDKPVVVADDNWSIPALNGFPGPYMKSVNHWFTAHNFLDLTHNLEDKTTILTQTIVFMDENGSKVFSTDTRGTILPEARGGGHEAWAQVTTMEGDNGKTVAEMYLQDGDHYERSPAKIWHDFAKWYKEYAG